MYILAIETSCDETCASVLKDYNLVLSNVVHSQIDIHKEFGGVIPELASREHIEYIDKVILKALSDAKINPEDIDLVAATKGPGLVGCLLIGYNAAKMFSLIYEKPMIDINHLKGHIYASFIENEVKLPALALVVSGGNTEIVYFKSHKEFEVVADTLDDAVGESYDKIGKVLGLNYPAGALIDKMARLGNRKYKLPIPKVKENEFSFSGLKTASINLINKEKDTLNVNDFAKSLVDTINDILEEKCIYFLKKYNLKNLIIAGGVSANSHLKERFYKYNDIYNIYIPSIKYSTDNAAMIGANAYFEYLNLIKDNNMDDLNDLSKDVNPSLYI